MLKPVLLQSHPPSANTCVQLTGSDNEPRLLGCDGASADQTFLLEHDGDNWYKARAAEGGLGEGLTPCACPSQQAQVNTQEASCQTRSHHSGGECVVLLKQAYGSKPTHHARLVHLAASTWAVGVEHPWLAARYRACLCSSRG